MDAGGGGSRGDPEAFIRKGGGTGADPEAAVREGGGHDSRKEGEK